MDKMHLFCITDVNCPPVELKRTKDGFSHRFILKEPFPEFLVLFSQGKWLDSTEDLCLQAKLTINNNCENFGVLSKNNKSIMKEVNLDSLSKKKALLEVKPINVCSSQTSGEMNEKTKDVSAGNAELKKPQKVKTQSAEKSEIKNSSGKSKISQKEKKSVTCSKKKIALLENSQEKTSPREDRNLKEVENLRDPKEMGIPCEKSYIESEKEIAKSEDLKSTLDSKELKRKGGKKVGSKKTQKMTDDMSQIPDSDMKETKENVPKAKSNKTVKKTKPDPGSNSLLTIKKDQTDVKVGSINEEEMVKGKPKSKDENLSKADQSKKTLKVQTGKRDQDLNKMENEGKKLSKANKSSQILNSKSDSTKKNKAKKPSKSAAKNNILDSEDKITDICKSTKTISQEKKKKKTKVAPSAVEGKSKDLLGKKLTPKDGSKKDNLLKKKSANVSQVVKANSVKNKVLPKKKTVSKFSKDSVKTKQTTLQFGSLNFADKTKEKSILKESGTPSKKRKRSVSFNNTSTQEDRPEELQLPNDSKESETHLELTPKRRKIKVDIESGLRLKDTEALMNHGASENINDKNADDSIENTTEKTPHVKITCKTPSPPKPPQKCKNKRVNFDVTPDSGSTPKKRSPKRIRTLKNEFAKSASFLKESSKKHPAICKDVTDRSCHPSERWGPTLSMVAPNKAILIGGQGEKQVLNKDSVWSLNPETRKWKQLETKSEGPRPDLRMGHTATYDPTVRCIYIYGGSKNLKWFNDVHALDVDEKFWQLVKVTGKAPTRAYHTACLYRHEIWIFGGIYPNPDPQPDGCSNEIHVFSPIMGNWYMPIVNGEKPAARSGHSATIIKEEMVVFGGWDFPYSFNDIYILDLSLVEWRKPAMKGAPPKPRSWHASCALSHSRVLIHGGYDGDIALDDIHIFDVATMCWMEILLTSSPVPRVGHTCLCLPFTSANEDDDEVLIFGGGDNEKKFFCDLFSISVPFRPAIKADQNMNGNSNSNQEVTVS